MTNKELQIVKERTIYKNELKELKNQILELGQEPKVKEYLSLIQKLEEKTKNDSPIIISGEQTNYLLFKYGLFSLKENIYDYYVPIYLYRDLETQEFFWYTSYKEYKKVCRSYILEKDALEKKDCEFEMLREKFFEQLLNKPQEEVVWEMLENNKQLVKGKKK